MKKLTIAEQHQLALADRYHSVIESQAPKYRDKLLLGVKDSPAIKKEWISALEPLFQRHTRDAMAHRGRAVDMAMTNPLTGRCMTGSSSGTAVNVLLGINDLGMGTDGGGSVIYPAMAVNLYSVILSGLGFQGGSLKNSTDGIAFRPGLGLIGFHSAYISQALDLLVGKKSRPSEAVIAGDEASLHRFQVSANRISPPDTDERKELIAWTEAQWQRADILLLRESHIDIRAYGDSILGFSSPHFRTQQGLSGKKIGKILNMVQASAFTVPDGEAASGYLIIAKPGRPAFDAAREIFESVEDLRTKLFLDYFGS